MAALEGKICIVTGASRGIGRGIAIGLCEAGATVHITGRTLDGTANNERPGSLRQVVEEAQALPGRCIAHQCDHASVEDTERVLDDILAAEGRVDLLVNNAWGGYENMVENDQFTWVAPLWEQPLWRWDAMMEVGVRSAYVAARSVSKPMADRGAGLIVNISFWAAQKFMANVVYGLAKAAMDKLAADLACQLRPHGIAALSLYPGLVRTEAVMRNAQFFDLSNSESPQFIGRVIAALVGDPQLMDKSGQVQVAAGLAAEYGIIDIDGKRPRPLTLAELGDQ